MAAMPESLTVLTDETFATETAEGVWLVLFWDYTCGQCKLLKPIMADLAGTTSLTRRH